MRILVDLDGIVADTLPHWLRRIYYLTGVRATLADITKWNLNENPPLTLLQPNQIFDILNEPGFNVSIPEMSDATLFLKKLHDVGHDISVVTARFGPVAMPETLQWLHAMMPWFDAEKKTFFCYDKHRVDGDILIDDKAETLIKYNQEHPAAKLITIDYPYNQHAPANTIRVSKNGYEWEQIESYINKLTNENL